MKDNDVRLTADSELIEARAFAGVDDFDLDPCGSPLRAEFLLKSTAKKHYMLERGQDGLSLPWFGRVFVNPPFSDIEPWIEKAFSERTGIKSATFLLPANRMEQPWAQRVQRGEWAGDLKWQFLAGRRNYIFPDGKLKKGIAFGSMLVHIWGDARE
jgi:hypothetical protein